MGRRRVRVGGVTHATESSKETKPQLNGLSEFAYPMPTHERRTVNPLIAPSLQLPSFKGAPPLIPSEGGPARFGA
jgi:hypothetical protein